LNAAQYNEEKLQKLHSDYKKTIKSIKNEVEEQLYSNGKIFVIKKF
jgi:hypothetical protein